MKKLSDIQNSIDKTFEDFLTQMLRLNEDRLMYYYWTVDFFETVGNLSFRYFHMTQELKDSINVFGKEYFEESEVYFEINKYSHRHDLNIRNINKLFADYNKSGQQAKYEYLKEFVLWQLLQEVLEAEKIAENIKILSKAQELQKKNFLFTYARYLIENTEKPTFDVLRQYKKYTLTNQGEVLEKKIKELSDKGVDNYKLIYKINQLYILRDDEPRIHFIFSRVGGEEKEELRELLDVMGREDTGKLYRGQACSTWKLNSSLTREPKYLANESDMYYDILSLKPDAFTNDHSIYERLITMQHFGMPTRLLDITRNPLVAIFFACNNLQEAKKDGVVFTFSPDKKKFLNFEDDKLSCLQTLYNKDTTKTNLDKDTIKEFLSDICFIKGVAKNQRINNQSGDFIFVGTGKDVPEKLRALPRLNIIIDSQTKKVLLEQLESLNIHGGAVYPDLTHMSNYIRHKYLDEKRLGVMELLSDFDMSAYNTRQSKKLNKSKTTTKKDSGKIEELTTPDYTNFWNSKRLQALVDFVNTNNLKSELTRKIIQSILDFNKPPLRDDIIEAMKNKPPLIERSKKGDELIERIMSFTEELKNIAV